ncbi:MAG TPA: cbb3-type cytochrome oxidase assembly protein CcoS [Planctomycetota bacterium]|jgi:cbb3-type cytochrome oxidase maturation protein|nr:cbb3-type cytochrome oxidase assembly protein CcoS [Planctomycetota bacterium]
MIPVALALEWMLFAIAALMGLTAWLVYVWAVRDGQFRNVEEAAQRLLDQDARD